MADHRRDALGLRVCVAAGEDQHRVVGQVPLEELDVTRRDRVEEVAEPREQHPFE
jgi:hypothetical protein